jgi:lipopolysaccharide transport system permease protein
MQDVRATIIEPRRRWIHVDLAELWQYRDLLFFLGWRDVAVRYKQTVLGVAWAILQPLTMMVIFTLFFGRLAKVPSDGVAYPIFSYAALLPWQFFATSMTHAANSLVENSSLLTKVYFPRLMIPVASLMQAAVDFAVAFVILLGMMVYYGTAITWKIAALPGLLLLALMAAAGVGLWLSAMNVKYRDIRYTIPFLVQAWMFVSPVVYPASLVPEQWRWLYGLNPMSGVIEGFRWALVGTNNQPGTLILVSAVVSVVLLLAGLAYFFRTEDEFADVV